MKVVTPRLDLVVLTAPLVAALAAGDVTRAQRLAPFPLDERTFADDGHVLALRHAQLTIDPAQEPWLLHAAVLRDTGAVVGRVGFHAPPDADGVVEIGYATSRELRGQGLAREMAVGLINWAAGAGARTCLASIRPDNTPSLAIADRLGFQRIGEQIDDIDGLEWVFALLLDGALPTYDGRR